MHTFRAAPHSKTPAGAILGGVLGALFALMAVIGFGIWYRRRQPGQNHKIEKYLLPNNSYPPQKVESASTGRHDGFAFQGTESEKAGSNLTFNTLSAHSSESTGLDVERQIFQHTDLNDRAAMDRQGIEIPPPYSSLSH